MYTVNPFYGHELSSKVIPNTPASSSEKNKESILNILTNQFYELDMAPEDPQDRVNEFVNVVRLYDHFFTMMCKRLPCATKSQRKNLHDHACTYALNPGFYNEGMVSRFNNTMLIGALLLSACVSMLLAPRTSVFIHLIN